MRGVMHCHSENFQRPACELDRISTVGCVKLAQAKGASAQAAFGAGNPP